MSKKRARIRIAQEYHDTALESLRQHNPFEAEPERDPVLMHHVSSPKGWAAIEIGVLEKAAATPRKFAAFARFLDERWNTDGAVNGSNLRAGVHTAAFRMKAQHEEILSHFDAQTQASIARLKAELQRMNRLRYAALAEGWRLKHAKLDSRAQDEMVSRADASLTATAAAFAKANPSHAAIVDTVKDLVKVDMVIAAMRFTGPPKRLRVNSGTSNGTDPTDEADQTETTEAPTKNPEDNQKPASKSEASSEKSGKKQTRAKAPDATKPLKVELASLDQTQADLLLSGKVAELMWDGAPGYVIAAKVPSDLANDMRDLGLMLVDYRVNEELRPRFWAKDLDLVMKAMEKVEQGKAT